MAITFFQVPEEYSPGFNPMVFVASSSAAHNTQFRFNTEIRDASGVSLAGFVNVKQPSTGNLVFDAHRTVENYLSYDITNLIGQVTGWQYGVNVFKKYYINVIEEYPRLVFHASGDSSAIYAINASMDWTDYVTNGLGGRVAGTSSRNWLSNQPTRIKVRVADSYEMGTIVDSVDAIYYLKIETYGVSNVLLKTATIRNYNYSLADDSHRFPSILCGPDDLNNSTLTTGTQSLIGATTAWYRIAAFNIIDVQTLRWKEFEVDRTCTRDDTYVRLFFLNQLGRFDAFNFDFMSDDLIEVTKAKYDKLLGVHTSGSFTFNTYQQQTSVFHSKVEQKYKLRSCYVDNDTALWLKELIASPLIYVIINGSFVACTIEDTRYQSKKTEVEKLFNIELTINLSVASQRQRL